MLKRLLALLVCCIAALLPIRLRIAFTEALGWICQGCYFVAFRVARFLVRSLRD